MVAEFYPGWLAHWAEKFPRVDAGTVARQTDKYLKTMYHSITIWYTAELTLIYQWC